MATIRVKNGHKTYKGSQPIVPIFRAEKSSSVVTAQKIKNLWRLRMAP
jgi:hypothetical protein